MADEIQTKNITTVDTITSIDNTDKVFVNDNGSFKQISVSNLMKQAPSGVTEETDPTVSEWAKQPTKPSYTADEVGALPVGTKIPTKTSDLTNDSGYLTQIPEEYVTETELGQKGYVIEDDIPEKLPSPGTLTFTGAVNDTYDGSANKTINIPTGGGEGGTSDYNALANKPKLNGVEIAGNKTSTDYKIVSSEQGIENNGKFLGIGADGNVTPVDKPTYTADEVGARPDTWTPSAEDVGALPNDTEIPSKTSDLENDSGFITNSDIPEKLPNPQKIIFTGAVSAEYDGSSQQTINIPTGGGSDPYTLPIMSSTQLGGGKAVEKTDEDVPVAVDLETGQLFVPTYPENTGGGGGTVDPEQIKQAVNGYLEENPVSGMTAEQEQQLNQNTTDVADLRSALEQIEGGGWSSTQIDLFEAFTNVIAYTSPDANSIVSSLISSLRSGSSDTPEDSFSIINILSNVTSSSKVTSVKSGEPYNTTLTANPGYELESVIVKMGGSDITSTAYSDGEITISAVTGNIVITASAVQSSASGQLPQDGLADYFDFRNKTYTAGSGGLYYMNSDFGSGMLYSWTNQSGKQGDDIGLKGAGGNYTTERATGYPVTDNFPSTRTVCLFGKGGPSVPNSIGTDGTVPNTFLYRIKYRATDETTKSLPNEKIQYPEGFNKTGYNASFVIVNQNILKIYFDDTLHKTVDGSEIEDFESWDITPLALTSFSNYGTAYAIYNKELSKVEIVEALEFFKTLEVSE